MKFAEIAVASLAALGLAGCGGGSGGSGGPASSPPVAVTPPPVVVAPPVFKPVLVKSTSYGNAKDQGLAPIVLPAEMSYSDAYMQADFRQDGSMMLFAALLHYDLKNPASKDTPSTFAFYSKNASGAWVKEANMIDTPNGCVHPRKAVVADFNQDGKPDVLVACHGYDAAPYTGEPNYLVLSTASGSYVSKPVGGAGFYHNATAADFNGDGKMDYVATDTNHENKLRMFLGNGDGSFTEDSTKMPAALRNNYYFTVEATDVDGDGKIDLLLGADELLGKSHSVVVYGDGTGNFTASRVVNLPTDLVNATVLDFVVKNRAIYALRTSSDASSFYNTTSIQKVDITTMAGTTVYSTSGQGWVKWLIPTATGVASDNAQSPASASY
jgi:hypothetical protein